MFMARLFPVWKYVNVMASEREKMCHMLLLWNPQTVDLVVVRAEEQVIHSKIRCMLSRNLWDSLVDFGLQGGPYFVSGDLNAVMHVDKHRGRRKPENKGMDGPIQACATIGLQDTPSIGCHFTWSNGNVFSKIDRTMVNQQW